MKSKANFNILFVIPALLIVLVFMYFPILMNFFNSLYRMTSYSSARTFVGFQHYRKISSDPIFYTALKNNALYAIFSVVFQVGFGMLLAILLEGKFVGRKIGTFFRNVLFIPSIISIPAVALLWYFIYHPRIGLLNGILASIGLDSLKTAWLANPNTAIYSVIMMSQWQYTGYIMVLLVVAIQKIPRELYESAEIDGANEFRKAIHITIPSIRSMISVCTIITVIGSFKLFSEIYIMTGGGPYNTTQVLGTYMYRSAFLFDEMGYGSAVAVIIFVITFGLSLVQLKSFKST